MQHISVTSSAISPVWSPSAAAPNRSRISTVWHPVFGQQEHYSALFSSCLLLILFLTSAFTNIYSHLPTSELEVCELEQQLCLCVPGWQKSKHFKNSKLNLPTRSNVFTLMYCLFIVDWASWKIPSSTFQPTEREGDTVGAWMLYV